MIKWFFNDHIAHIFQVIASADMVEMEEAELSSKLFLHFARSLLRSGAVYDITRRSERSSQTFNIHSHSRTSPSRMWSSK